MVIVCNYSLKTAKWESCKFKFCERNPYISDLSDTSKEAACEVHADDVVSKVTAKTSRRMPHPPKKNVSMCSS